MYLVGLAKLFDCHHLQACLLLSICSHAQQVSATNSDLMQACRKPQAWLASSKGMAVHSSAFVWVPACQPSLL